MERELNCFSTLTGTCLPFGAYVEIVSWGCSVHGELCPARDPEFREAFQQKNKGVSKGSNHKAHKNYLEQVLIKHQNHELLKIMFKIKQPLVSSKEANIL